MSGPSVTATCVAALRAAYTCAPPPLAIVDDPFAKRLIPRPLARIASAMGAGPKVGWLLHRSLALISADLSTNLPLRTAAIDDVLRDLVKGGPKQLVLLGSGLDARAWRMGELASCSMFELDRPGAHAVKLSRLAGFPHRPRRHRLVPIDFERQEISEVLSQAGFRYDQPTIWLWEAVMVYLTPEAIAKALDGIASLSAPGSALLATYTTPNLGQGSRPSAHWRLAAWGVGESVAGEMTPEALHEALARREFEVVSDETASDWAARYWPASERQRARGWERLVVARRLAS